MVVKGHAEMLTERLFSGATGKEDAVRHNVEQIQGAAERAAGDAPIARVQPDQVLHPRVLALNEVVGNMIQMVSRVIGKISSWYFSGRKPGAGESGSQPD